MHERVPGEEVTVGRSLGPFRWAALIWAASSLVAFAVMAALWLPAGFVDWLGIPGPTGIAALAVSGTSPVGLAFAIAAAWERRHPR